MNTMRIGILRERAARWLYAHAGRWRPHITRTRIGLLAATLLVVGLSLGGIEATPPEPSAHAVSIDLDLPQRPFAGRAAIVPTTLDAATAGALELPPVESWDEVTVRSGQTLDRIFRDQGFSIALLQEILALNSDTDRLAKIRPGDVFGFQRDDAGGLMKMRYPIDEDAYLLVENGPDGPRAERLQRDLFTETNEASGRIESSLFLAGKQAGLTDPMVTKLANIFGWDIDFVLDIRAGDRFHLIYEKIYRDGEFLRDGEILAATFVNQGQRFRAIRFEIDGAGRYFAPDGSPMRKAFLRAPLNFSYISSNFNPRRFHPILRRVKAHNGIDYRAPTGTPVYAAGDGRVIRSAYSKYNGHHVFIQHSGSIETRYLHFTKRTVKQNQRVRQGQVIGYVGATGLATAPHLHYEFLVNGAHRNPRTIALPKVDPLEGEQLAAFQAHAAPWQSRLGRLESASLYAERE